MKKPNNVTLAVLGTSLGLVVNAGAVSAGDQEPLY